MVQAVGGNIQGSAGVSISGEIFHEDFKVQKYFLQNRLLDMNIGLLDINKGYFVWITSVT